MTEKKHIKKDVSLQEVKEAVRTFEKKLEKGIKRTVLLKEDQSIDFEFLTSILGGMPNQSFYMSRETYEIFEQSDREIPYHLDRVQRALDNYVREFKEYPLVPSDLYRKININKLINTNYLSEKPPFDLYLTHDEDLITHKKPK